MATLIDGFIELINTFGMPFNVIKRLLKKQEKKRNIPFILSQFVYSITLVQATHAYLYMNRLSR